MTTSTNTAAGAVWRTARECAGLTLEQLADHAGIHPSILAQIESGERHISGGLSWYLAGVLVDVGGVR